MKRTHLRFDKNSFDVFKNATIIPTERNNKQKEFIGSAYDNKGLLIDDTKRYNAALWTAKDPKEIELADEEIPFLEGRSIYMGYITKHYGHFLMETLSRMWFPAQSKNYDRLIFQHYFVEQFAFPDNYIFQPFEVFKKALGIDNSKVHFITEKSIANTLVVPKEQLVIGRKVSAKFRKLLDVVVNYCQKEFPKPNKTWGKKIYLSRSMWNKKRFSCINETEVEKIFIAKGFKIIHPQTMPYEEQVALINHADVIAGFNGSSLHNVMFAKHNTKIIGLGNTRVHQKGRFHGNQKICNELINAKTFFIPFKGKEKDHHSFVFNTNYLERKLDGINSRISD